MSHKENLKLLQALNDCARECNHCFVACLHEQDVKMLKSCIKLDRDCADICQLTASFIARGSEFGRQMLNLCIEICEECATECEKHADHMDHCKACAEECRACAEECRSMIEEHV